MPSSKQFVKRNPNQSASNVVPLKVSLPHILYRWFDVAINHPSRIEILLFRTVILDAFYDLAKQCPKAEAWLLTPSADLAEVADYAEVTPDQVHAIAHSIKAGLIKLPAWRIWRYTWSDVQ